MAFFKSIYSNQPKDDKMSLWGKPQPTFFAPVSQKKKGITQSQEDEKQETEANPLPFEGKFSQSSSELPPNKKGFGTSGDVSAPENAVQRKTTEKRDIPAVSPFPTRIDWDAPVQQKAEGASPVPVHSFPTRIDWNAPTQKKNADTSASFAPHGLAASQTLQTYTNNSSRLLQNKATTGLAAQRKVAQFGLWDKIKDKASGGVNWLKDKAGKTFDSVKNIGGQFVEPIKTAISAGSKVAKTVGGDIQKAWSQTDLKWTSFVATNGIPLEPVFTFANNLRKITVPRAISVAKSAGLPPAIPALLSQTNELADKMAGVMEKGFDIKNQIVEGAILGDFKENPSGWNTLGQVAIGFVPIAGQIADVRDIIANGIKLYKSGGKDGGAWFDLAMSVVAIIPGVGDAIKGAGRFLKGPAAKLFKKLAPKAGKLWEAASGKAGKLLSGIGTLGKGLLSNASAAGKKLFSKAQLWGKAALGKLKGMGGKALSALSAVKGKLAGFLGKAKQAGQSALSKAGGFLGKMLGPVKSIAEKIIGKGKTLVSSAMDFAKKQMDNGKKALQNVKQALAKRMEQAKQKATKLLEKARNMADSLKKKAQDLFKRGKELAQKAKEWKDNAVKKGRELVSNGVSRLKKAATDKIKKVVSGITGKIKSFLTKKWDDIKNSKLGKLGAKALDTIKNSKAGKWAQKQWGKLKDSKAGKWAKDKWDKLKKDPNASRKAGEAVTKEFVKSKLPQSFVDSLKSFGKTEDEIIDYFVKYHNERSGKRFFDDIDEFLAKNKKLKLTDAEATGLWGYTTHLFYKDLNNWLRAGKNADKTKDIEKLVNQGLGKMPKYAAPQVFRGITIDPTNLADFLETYKKGKANTWNDFTSCGGSRDASFGGRPDVNVIFEILHKDGKEISDVADGIKYGKMPKPEILIKSGSEFTSIADPIFDTSLNKWIIKLIQTK